jgi:DNA-binding IclR family transcriptional regulator
MPVTGKKYFFIGSLAKGLDVMELLVERGDASVSEVARALGFNRASSHRFLSTLQELGYVDKSEQARYSAGMKMLEMGLRLAARLEVRKISKPYMQRLAETFKETVNLGLYDSFEVLHVDKIDSLEILRIDARSGSRAPAYCTALGKVILAFLPPDEQAVFFKQVKLRRHGPNTIRSKKMLKAALARIQEKGFAVDDEELSAGLRCVAAPIFDHNDRASYALSISGPAVRLSLKRIERIQPRLRKCCREISAKLGGNDGRYQSRHRPGADWQTRHRS